MNRTEALRNLRGDAPHARLQAARVLARDATAADASALRQALRHESVSFVRRALEQALTRIDSTTPSPKTNDPPYVDEDPSHDRQAYTRAVEWVTSSLLHEILPRVGALRIEARRAVHDYESSALKGRIDALASVLLGLEELRKASVSTTTMQFNVSELIASVVTDELRKTSVSIHLQGIPQLIASGDNNLLRLALGNGLRNAIEATASLMDENRGVIVSWGDTEVDYWITVLDEGPGIPGPSEAAFEIGRTTKSGHRGFGLAIARQAMITLDGSIALYPARSGGVRLEMRWFK